MLRNKLMELIQRKIDAEIGNRATKEIVFTIRMQDGGIRQVSVDVTTSTYLGEKK